MALPSSKKYPEQTGIIDTVVYKKETVVGNLVRSLLRAVILPFAPPEKRPAYAGQFGEASRNLEIVVEKLLWLAIKEPRMAWLTAQAITDWLLKYHGTQIISPGQEHYIVYTELDHRIPFVPEEDTMYSYMISQAAFCAAALAETTTPEQFTNIVAAFRDANALAAPVFQSEQTIMPRFTQHDRLSLKAVQMLDKPLNCCPSLHITYSLLIDNIASIYIKPLRAKTQLFESLRYSTLRMFNSVLYTKQHALIDVAFGMLCAKKILEKRFQRPYDDLTKHFSDLSRNNPHIDYGRIISVYRDIVEIDKTGIDYLDTMRNFFSANGFVKVTANTDVNSLYFDTGKRTLVTFA